MMPTTKIMKKMMKGKAQRVGAVYRQLEESERETKMATNFLLPMPDDIKEERRGVRNGRRIPR